MSTNSSAEKERDLLGREMETLKQKIEALDGKYKQATQTVCSLEADKVTADRELKQIRKQNAYLERNMEKLKKADNRNKKTSTALAQITKTYKTLVKTHETLTKTSEKLKSDLDVKTAELVKEIKVKVLNNLLLKAKSELEVKASNIELLTHEKSEETRLKKETDQILLITVGKLDKTQHKLAELEEKVQALTEKLAEALQVIVCSYYFKKSLFLIFSNQFKFIHCLTREKTARIPLTNLFELEKLEKYVLFLSFVLYLNTQVSLGHKERNPYVPRR